MAACAPLLPGRSTARTGPSASNDHLHPCARPVLDQSDATSNRCAQPSLRCAPAAPDACERRQGTAMPPPRLLHAMTLASALLAGCSSRKIPTAPTTARAARPAPAQRQCSGLRGWGGAGIPAACPISPRPDGWFAASSARSGHARSGGAHPHRAQAQSQHRHRARGLARRASPAFRRRWPGGIPCC